MSEELKDSIWAIHCVWLRYLDVFKKRLLYGVLTTFLEPILYLASFGYGMGSFIGELEASGMTLSYRQFVFSGIVGQTLLFQGFFEGAYGSFIRMYYQRIFKAMATTPITLSEVLWGELLWDSTKATFAATVVLLIGVIAGDFSLLGSILAVPVCFMGALLFSSFGLWTASNSKTIEEISYPQYLILFPMFLFCGVFYPLEQLPETVQYFAWIFPLTSVLSLVRTLTLGFPFEPQALFGIIFWTIFLVGVSRWTMIKRLIR